VRNLLIISGGALQLFGVIVVFIEVARIRNAVEAFRRRPQTIYGSAALFSGDDFATGIGTVSGAREPTTHD
jgi:hypothetical protein